MKKIIHFLSFLIVLVCLFPFLFGCTSGFVFSQDQPTTITVWHFYTSGLKTAFEDMINDFNNTYGSEHNIIVEAENQEDLDTLAASIIDSSKKKVGADKLPNIIFAYTGTVLELDRQDFVANLDDYFTKDELSRYYPSFLEEGRIGEENKLECFPVAKSTELLFINKADFDEFAKSANDSGLYGKVSADDFSTFEGIANLSDIYYKWTDAKTPSVQNDGKSFFGMDATPNFISVGLRQLGNVPVTVSGATGTFSMDKEAARRLWGFYYSNIVTGRFAEIGRYRADDMKTGDLVAYLGSSGGATYFPEEIMPGSPEARKTDLLVLPYPVFQGAKAVSIQQGAGMSVIKTDKQHEEASAQFIKWFTDPAQNVKFSYMSGYQPVQKAEFIRDAQEKEIAGLKNATDTALQNTLAALQTASRQFNDYELTVDKEFTGSYDVRNMFGMTLSEAAKNARSSLLVDLQAGKTLDEALPGYLDSANFENWYNQIQKEFSNLTAGE